MVPEFINIDGNSLRLTHNENGHTMAFCDDMMRLVGLPQLTDKSRFDTFMKLLGLDAELLLKFVSYECDLKLSIVLHRVKRYLLIDCGIKMTRTNNPDIRENDFEVTRYYLELLDDKWYTQADVLEMLNEQGFNVKLY